MTRAVHVTLCDFSTETRPRIGAIAQTKLVAARGIWHRMDRDRYVAALALIKLRAHPYIAEIVGSRQILVHRHQRLRGVGIAGFRSHQILGQLRLENGLFDGDLADAVDAACIQCEPDICRIGFRIDQ